MSVNGSGVSAAERERLRELFGRHGGRGGAAGRKQGKQASKGDAGGVREAQKGRQGS